MSKKNRCPYCGSTQTRFLRKKKVFTCYDCDGEDWIDKEEEDNGFE